MDGIEIIDLRSRRSCCPMHRWSDSGGMPVFRERAGFANGQTRDREGRLIGCSHQDRCTERAQLDGSAFGGRNRSRLFTCAGRALYAIYVNRGGAERP